MSGADIRAILTPYQRRWIDDSSRFKIGMFARQAGKTFTTTLEVVEDCLAAEAAGRRARWVILSRGERQALEAMNEGVKLHLRAYEKAYEAIDYDCPIAGASYRAAEVALPGGSRITALPANPDTARGFSANVFLDEFAFHKDSRAIWKALFPVISKPGLKIRIVSTPNGKSNKFYELMTASGERWSRHRVDIYQAVAEGLPRDIEELREACGDEDAWAQEFELKWLDEASAWLTYELIDGVEHDLAGLPEHYAGGPCFIGNDIARRNDLWVAWVLEQVGDVFWTREIRTLRGATFKEQDRTMDELFDRYRVVRLAMDQTGMGEKPVEDAQNRYGAGRVEGILFSAPNKQMLATGAKQQFEDRRLRIPAGDSKLRADLHKLKKITSETGAPRFVADADAEGHADRAWSCFLALKAANNPIVEYAYQSGREEQSERRHPEDEDDGPAEACLHFRAGTW
ncbi:MAG: hypothetical protein RLZZ501_858 [Pseudomonadota bacterium]|jgi:phage FluMu gp28-like protein